MKKILLIVGIISIVLCVLFVLSALFNMFGYHNLYDGTQAHYNRLHQRVIYSWIIGGIFAVIGAVCIIKK